MTPPTNIDGTEITGATIDGQDVQEITVDGQTVFTKVPEALVSHWTFDNSDVSGTTAFDIVGGHDMTLKNGPTTGVSGATQTYNTNEAVDFDGTNDFGEVTHVSDFDTPDGFSLALWAKVTNTGSAPIFTAKRNDSGAYSWELGIGNAGSFLFRLNANSNQVNGTQAPLNVFVHLVATYDKSQMKIYTDGVERDSLGLTQSVQTNTQNISFGSREFVQSGEARTDGGLDDFRFYDRALSASEVSNLYNTGSIL